VLSGHGQLATGHWPVGISVNTAWRWEKIARRLFLPSALVKPSRTWSNLFGAGFSSIGFWGQSRPIKVDKGWLRLNPEPL
jgi:hypothetical protein